MERNQALFDWDYVGYGGTITLLETGDTVWLQGHDADEFNDNWENCEEVWQQNVLADQYFG